MKTGVRLFLLVLCMFGPALSVIAQDCGYGAPCVPIQANFPGLPQLESPTPLPTYVITVTPTVDPLEDTPTPTFTPTTTETPISAYDPAELDDRISTLEYLSEVTEEPLFSAVEFTQAATDLGAGAGTFFGYVRGFAQLHFGPFTPLVVFILLAFFVVFFVRFSTIVFPVLVVVWKIIRQGIELVLDFIPF